MTAAFLVAAERAWDGHHRQAFALGIVPCLDRPEVWPLWGLYGLWLMWKDRGRAPAGDRAGHPDAGAVDRAAEARWRQRRRHRASRPTPRTTTPTTSAVNSSFPFWNELAYKLWPLVLERLEFAAAGADRVHGLPRGPRARRQLGTWRSAVLRLSRRGCGFARRASSASSGGCGISVETQAGFAGNPRYAVIGRRVRLHQRRIRLRLGVPRPGSARVVRFLRRFRRRGHASEPAARDHDRADGGGLPVRSRMVRTPHAERQPRFATRSATRRSCASRSPR